MPSCRRTQPRRDASVGERRRDRRRVSRATFGGHPRHACEWVRVVVRRWSCVAAARSVAYQSAKKVVTRTSRRRGGHPLDELLGHGFAGRPYFAANRKKSTFRRAARAASYRPTRWANRVRRNRTATSRVKDVPLPEGKATACSKSWASPRGRHSARRCARIHTDQRVLEQLRARSRRHRTFPNSAPSRNLDCGCGSSLSHLAAHHYLNDFSASPRAFSAWTSTTK